MPRNKKITNLITGGAGFIGSYLSEALLKKGENVFVIDDLSTGRYQNIQNLIKNNNFKFFRGSITTDGKLLDRLIKNSDIIYHLAAAVGVKKIIKDSLESLETNIIGTHNVLKLAAKYNKKTLITSTSEVYGKSDRLPFEEDWNDCVLGPTIKSRWSYATSKILDELLALAYFREKKLPVIIIRFFNIVGPRQRGEYGMVIPIFVRQALNQKPITIFGDGKQSRCFLYVGEAVGALIKLMNNKKAIGQIINLGNDQPITIENLAKKIKEATNSKSPIIYKSYEEAYEAGFEDMQKRIPSLIKINKLISFKPQKNIDFIIKTVVNSIKNEK